MERLFQVFTSFLSRIPFVSSPVSEDLGAIQTNVCFVYNFGYFPVLVVVPS